MRVVPLKVWTPLNADSGINPATLSGAIDVIVVRHVDKQGQETLSSTPFHVRFGKLQVLRAGEKRVTIKLPGNLEEPAPFDMKVGEAGEAFFVVETDQEVPEELMTSPVVKPTDVSWTGESCRDLNLDGCRHRPDGRITAKESDPIGQANLSHPTTSTSHLDAKLE